MILSFCICGSDLQIHSLNLRQFYLCEIHIYETKNVYHFAKSWFPQGMKILKLLESGEIVVRRIEINGLTSQPIYSDKDTIQASATKWGSYAKISKITRSDHIIRFLSKYYRNLTRENLFDCRKHWKKWKLSWSYGRGTWFTDTFHHLDSLSDSKRNFHIF